MTYEITDSEILSFRQCLVEILLAATRNDDIAIFEKCGAIGRVLNEIKTRGGSIELSRNNGH